MREFAERLARLGPVSAFDYAYQRAGRRTPDRQPLLLQAHREALTALRAAHSEPAVLIGKSMGGRMGCHLAVELAENAPRALVCLGYPLIGQNGSVRDEVLRALRTPVLFVQGTRDPMCPLGELDKVRAQMLAPNELHVVEGGDHSLRVAVSALKARQTTQAALDDGIIGAIDDFLKRH
jgi:predicted alpha/beta-hydrolase family hydrolase